MTRAPLAVLACIVAGCAALPAPSERPSSPATPRPAATADDAPAATATPQPQSASELLDCEGPVSESGGLASDFGPEGAGATPEEAFDAWRTSTAFVVPRSGYRPLGSIGDRHVWAFEVDGRPKVVVVISPRFGDMAGGAAFTIEELRMCDVAELGREVDLGPTQRAWTHEETGDLVTDVVGSAHCGWESARLLHMTDAAGGLGFQYLRDPLGVLGQAGKLETYADDVDLPADATFSGYRSDDGLELWLTPENRAAYVVRPDGFVERWPRAADPIGCV